jgi:hypothetical protein
MSQENVELARRAFEAFANGGADAVGDRVLVLAEFIGRAEGSGVPIRQKAAQSRALPNPPLTTGDSES